jgi:signal peptidase II
MKPLPLGIFAAVLAFGADQALKYWMLYSLDIENRAPVQVLPFFDIRIAWNRGISYSLFIAENEWARMALLAVYALACFAFIIWMIRATSLLTGGALGLLVGGASGNALDRLRYGAVADFFHVHFGSFSPWGVFNMADIAIVAGVGLLMYESILVKDKTS